MLTDFFINRGYQFFLSGWVQFAAAFGMSFAIMLIFGNRSSNVMSPEMPVSRSS